MTTNRKKMKPGPKGPRIDPALKKAPFNTRLSPYVIQALQACDNKAATVEAAIIRYLKLPAK